jgi:hypothetical protein
LPQINKSPGALLTLVTGVGFDLDVFKDPLFFHFSFSHRDHREHREIINKRLSFFVLIYDLCVLCALCGKN